MSWDWLLATAAEFWGFCHAEIVRRDWQDWVLHFVPVLLFFEIPRYYLPLLGVMFLHWLRLPREDEVARDALLRRAPLVSVVVAGRNESAAIERCINSLLEQDYPNYEIIIVDDSSDDEMYAIARRYAARGLIRLVRNRASRGRGGRPSATNLGLRLANGEFVVSLDADTMFGREMIRSLVACFADPRVGVVAGSVVPVNGEKNLLTRLQTIEYVSGIDLNKRWTHFLGSTMQASGAMGAFRRAAVIDIGGWGPELAEDADISLRMIKVGWRVAFAPQAVALTEVPHTMRSLGAQRARWDRGGVRTFFQKHLRLMDAKTFGNLPVALELASEGFFFVLGTLVFPFYLVWMWVESPMLLGFVLFFSLIAYSLLALLSLIPIRVVSRHSPPVGRLLLPALVMPLYKEWLRWVRVKAFVEELLLVRMDDSYLPGTAWANSPRF